MTLTALEVRPMVAETTHATVQFVDLRGYTSLAERLPPARVVLLLEELFAVLSSATELHGGQIFHIAGDGMMAGFGVRDPSRDGAREALAASHTMLRLFRPVAMRWSRELAINTGIGVGLHLGEVALGFFGPPGRQATTLVGDTVNVAARLCSRARVGEVLFSAEVAACLGAASDAGPLDAQADGPRPFLQLPKFALRGRAAPMDIWCLPVPERVELRDATSNL
jgi:adenylate cyclase